ncbi:MAG: sialate O-acetylesterase [Phycisphaeraceae bacterium]
MLGHTHPLSLLAVLLLAATGCAGEPKTGKHLFILSGQSNMTGTLEQAFTARVQARFGQADAVVVMRMKSGRGIRFWLADYRPPADRSFSDRAMAENGSAYLPLIDAATRAHEQASFDTVGFIWMQGESDGLNGLSEVYKESFEKLAEKLKKDLGRDDLYFVIARISDYGNDGPQGEHWRRVRHAQAALGQTAGNAWVDTDDLNGGGADQPNGGLHYPREGAAALGQRLAERAIDIIEQTP